ncbi:HNH endonuclease [Dyella marensis]
MKLKKAPRRIDIKNPRCNPWTLADIERLKCLYATHTASQVASLMGKSASRIKAAVAAYGLARSRSSMPRTPIGAERIMHGYRYVKVTDTGARSQDWKRAHHVLWEETNGPIPVDFVLKFKDGNRSNLSIDNLVLMPRSDHLKQNPFYQYPTELRSAMSLLRLLKRRMETTK